METDLANEITAQDTNIDAKALALDTDISGQLDDLEEDLDDVETAFDAKIGALTLQDDIDASSGK